MNEIYKLDSDPRTTCIFFCNRPEIKSIISIISSHNFIENNFIHYYNKFIENNFVNYYKRQQQKI